MHKDGDFGFVRLFEVCFEFNKISLEIYSILFKDICEVSKTYTFPADVSQLEFNKSKNRYINILTCKYNV